MEQPAIEKVTVHMVGITKASPWQVRAEEVVVLRPDRVDVQTWDGRPCKVVIWREGRKVRVLHGECTVSIEAVDEVGDALLEEDRLKRSYG